MSDILRIAVRVFFFIFPPIIMQNHWYRVRKFVRSIPGQLKPGARVLDAGAGSLAYRPVFAEKFRYVSQDIVAYPGLDIVSDIADIPVKSGSFDAIMSIQVLEHVRKPHEAMREFARILRPGGRLFLAAPHIFPVHMEPHDYYRYTEYSLRYLAEECGFRVRSIHPEGGIFIVIGKLLTNAVPKLFNDHPLVYYPYYCIFSVPLFLMNLICLLLDLLDRKKSVTLNYECVFEKPMATGRMRRKLR